MFKSFLRKSYSDSKLWVEDTCFTAERCGPAEGDVSYTMLYFKAFQLHFSSSWLALEMRHIQYFAGSTNYFQTALTLGGLSRIFQ